MQLCSVDDWSNNRKLPSGAAAACSVILTKPAEQQRNSVDPGQGSAEAHNATHSGPNNRILQQLVVSVLGKYQHSWQCLQRDWAGSMQLLRHSAGSTQLHWLAADHIRCALATSTTCQTASASLHGAVHWGLGTGDSIMPWCIAWGRTCCMHVSTFSTCLVLQQPCLTPQYLQCCCLACVSCR